MNLQGFLFDLDGTLANTLPMCIKAYRSTFEHFLHRSFSDEEIVSYFGFNEEGTIRKVMPGHVEEGLQTYHKIYEQLHYECQEPFVGITDALQLLRRRNVRMAVVTGKGIYTAELTLKYIGIDHYFDFVEVGDANAVVKMATIGKILDAWQIAPQHAAYIGDSAIDMTEAAAAGVLPLGACWAPTATIHELTSMQPYATFDSISAFIDWLAINVEPQRMTKS